MLDFEAPDWRALHSSLARRRRFAFCPVGYYLYHVPGRDGYSGMPGSWEYELYAAKHVLSSYGWITEFFRRTLRSYYMPQHNGRRSRFYIFLRNAIEYEFTLLENGEYRSDPKFVHRVQELDSGEMTLESFYDLAILRLNDLANHWQNDPLFGVLEKLPLIEFRTEPDGFRWKLGNVNFVNSPDLLWTDNGYWNVLDMNNYIDREELLRHAELYRAYIWRFMHIAPETVLVHNHDLFTRKCQRVERSGEDFRDIFLKLAGEAAMWRDYLLLQERDAENNIWHYARKDRCSCCRFEQLCPANGTYKNV